jgi:hypothetical protein
VSTTPPGYVLFTVEGRPFRIRQKAILTIGSGTRPMMDPEDPSKPITDNNGVQQFEVAPTALLFIKGFGTVLVDQTENEVMLRLNRASLDAAR